MPTSFLHMETFTGQPIRIGTTEVRARSQVVQLRLRLPVANGGLIWNRPVAVLVRTSHGQEQILPIRDLTRTAVLVLAGLSFASTLLSIFYRRKRVES